MKRAGRMSVAPRFLAIERVLAVAVLATSAACSSGAASSDAGAKSGTGGSGGSAGATGATGGVGDASSGSDGPVTATGQFTIVYNSTLTSTLTTCATCTGGWDATDGYAQMAYTMENAAGAPHTTAISITIGPGFQGATYAVNLAFLEDNPMLGSMYQGEYAYPNGVNYMNIGPGICFTFPVLNLVSGGGLSGTLDCDLVGVSTHNMQVAAHISGTFSATFVY